MINALWETDENATLVTDEDEDFNETFSLELDYTSPSPFSFTFLQVLFIDGKKTLITVEYLQLYHHTCNVSNIDPNPLATENSLNFGINC